MKIQKTSNVGMIIGSVLTLLVMMLQGCGGGAATGENTQGAAEIRCMKILGTKCEPKEEKFIESFLTELELYGIRMSDTIEKGDAPALDYLPKDSEGLVNWTKAVAYGAINPKSTLTGEPARGELRYDRLIMMQVRASFMANVPFPHAIHSYWLDCDSCHPKPFEPEANANPITMAAIGQGEFCGKCHGKVSFPLGPESNCRRCHLVSKTGRQF